ncbi:hypothetical protein HD806DRAFT_540263 [Xylariaceae sp. AK1471]|nr:hypothetical protein HD806DRAFT_540263 [Xylariaceae sp. AK1471]
MPSASSPEAIVAIVSLLVMTPPTMLLIISLLRRRLCQRQRAEQIPWGNIELQQPHFPP